jgi:hypothetical protein
MDACPHCGIPLPATVDAFCPECREDLSLTPEEAAVAARPAVVPDPDAGPGIDPNSWVVRQVTAFVLPLAAAMLVALIAVIGAGQWEAVGGFGLVFALCAAWVVGHYRAAMVKETVTGRDKTTKGTDQTK